MPPFTVALVVAFFLAITGAAIVLDRFGAESFFPGSHCGLPWTLGAFLLALTWERERELGGARKEAADLGARHGSEVRRRFESVATELQKNADSLESLSGVFEKPSPGVLMIANPQLLEGAWTANAPRLSELVADYRLIGDLAVTYGRIDELRWRLRYRTEHQTKTLDEMIGPLVDELTAEVDDVLTRVQGHTHNPTIRQPSIIHQRALGGKSITDLPGPAASRTPRRLQRHRPPFEDLS